jgi:flagellar protein FlbD
MIKVSRLRASEPELVVNAELIETVEATPDTVITLTTGHKVIVQESVDEVIRLVVAYKRLIHQPQAQGD